MAVHTDNEQSGQAEAKPTNFFGRWAQAVDGFLKGKFFRIGMFVGSRPFASIGLSLLLFMICAAGFSQVYSESRSEKLWIPQGTEAQDDSATYNSAFPPFSRMERVLLEAKSGSVLDKDFLKAAIELHNSIEGLTFDGKNLSALCVQQASNGHPCLINSVLGEWGYNSATLDADANPLVTLNAAGKSVEDLRRILGNAVFSGNTLVSAKALSITYFVQNNRQQQGGAYEDKTGDGWDDKLIDLLDCKTCKNMDSGARCSCGYSSPKFTVFAEAHKSRRDAFSSVIRGDVGLINAAFFIMIAYLIFNLGGLCHKVKSRALLALACTLSIVLAGASGYGIAMWFQFAYTPVHSVLPFVILGIGVDDSFVIMNALDRTDPKLAVPERIAHALSHAGASILVTSLTDFTAFCISISSALPALSSFCAYAAFCIIMLFFFQVTFFSALATLDTRRVAANRIDCCPCFCPKGCPCCPTKPVEDAEAAVERGERDPNQLCCTMSTHKGGFMGRFLECKLAPLLVRPAVAGSVIAVFFAFLGLCCWQMTLLDVEDASPKFIPDNSYVLGSMEAHDLYFGTLGEDVKIMTQGGDYFASQRAFTAMTTKINGLGYMQPTSGEAFHSWADSFKAACAVGQSAVGSTVNVDSDGYATVEQEYYDGLGTWLAGAGARYAEDVKWVDATNPRSGIRAARISAEYKPFNKVVDDKLVVDSDKAIEVMDGLRSSVDSVSGLPGAFPYTYNFLSWETFRIIKREMYLNAGLCLAAVLVITLVLIAHPVTAGLVFLSVVMTVIDILGCMNMWHLAIDNVSVIQLVISIGLCVDYAAHVGHCFMVKVGTKSERVIATLGDVGSAVLNGGISTFLAVMLLAFSKSYVFRVLFQTFFLTVVIGLAHGMIFLPALLSLVGPEGYLGAPVKTTGDGKTVTVAAAQES